MTIATQFIPILLGVLLFSNTTCSAKAINTQNTSEFLASTAKKFQRNYFPWQGYGNCRAVASFLLTEENKVEGISIIKPPTEARSHKKAKLADEALIQAVHSLSPLTDVPKELKRPIRIFLIFDGRFKGPVKMSASLSSKDALNENVREDSEVTARINQAEKELDDLRISFRWGKEQLDLVKRAADAIGIPYQTFLKMAVYQRALDVLKDVESSKSKDVA